MRAVTSSEGAERGSSGFDPRTELATVGAGAGEAPNEGTAGARGICRLGATATAALGGDDPPETTGALGAKGCAVGGRPRSGAPEGRAAKGGGGICDGRMPMSGTEVRGTGFGAASSFARALRKARMLGKRSVGSNFNARSMASAKKSGMGARTTVRTGFARSREAARSPASGLSEGCTVLPDTNV
jgi:hypothetical protein